MNAQAQQLPSVDPTMQRFIDERDLVGGLLAVCNPMATRAVKAIVGPEHFFDVSMRRVYHLCLVAGEAELEKFAFVHHVISELHADAPHLADVGFTPSSLVAHCIAESVTPEIGLEGAARQVRHNWLGEQLQSAVKDGFTEQAQQFAADMEALSRAHIDQGRNIERAIDISDRMITEMNDQRSGQSVPKGGMKIGVEGLADMLGKWERGDLVLIAGRPSMGKSTIATSVLIQSARASNEHVLFFSLEMTKQQVVRRMLSDLASARGASISYSWMKNNRLSDDQFVRVMDASETLKLLPISIDDRGQLTVDQMITAAQAERQKVEAKGRRLGVICIDHGGLIKPSGRYAGDKTREIQEVTAGLKLMAKSFDCTVICLVQLSRAVEGRENKRPQLSDLRDSGSWEQDADIVMFTYREAYYLERQRFDDMVKEDKRQAKLIEKQNVMEVLIEKNREGATGVVELYCNMAASVVRDREYGQ